MSSISSDVIFTKIKLLPINNFNTGKYSKLCGNR